MTFTRIKNYIKRKWKWFIGFFIPVAVVAVIMLDGAEESKYTDKGDRYETQMESSVIDSGESKAEMSKAEPKITLSKWNGEASLAIKYSAVGANASHNTSDNKIEWKDTRQELHAYFLPPGKSMEDGGFEIEVIWNEKPDTNTLEFELEGWENFDFLPQRPLWQENGLTAPTASCSDTECDDNNDGEIDMYRPEDIVNSFAVYHKTLKDHRMGSTNYATGKAYHIKRLKAIDNSGDEIWIDDVVIDNGMLRVTVPSDWVDRAEYPVRIDPTFGYTSIGATGLTIENFLRGSPGDADADQYTIPEGGTGSSLTAYVGGTGNTQLTKCNIYNIDDSALTNGQTEEIQSTGSDAWVTYNFTSAPTFVASTAYRLTCWSESEANTRTMFGDSLTDGSFRHNVTYGAWPDPVVRSAQNVRHSVYVTYTAAGGAATVIPKAIINGTTIINSTTIIP